MNRRNFLTKLGIGAAACAVVPAIAKEVKHPEDFEFNLKKIDERIKIIEELEGGRYAVNMDAIPSNMSPQDVIDFWIEKGFLPRKFV
jgi:hypothetical protein